MKSQANRWTLGRLAGLGALFIAGIAAEACYDVWRGYTQAVAGIERDMAAQARLIAEQTARGIQGIDLVLRHIGEQLGQGRRTPDRPEDLEAYLREQASGLVQAAGIAVIDTTTSRVAAAGRVAPAPRSPATGDFDFSKMGLRIEGVSRDEDGAARTFNIERVFAGPKGPRQYVVRAAGSIAYFQGFYGESFQDSATRVALMLRDGRLLARHPPAEAALGRRLAVIEQVLPQGGPIAATARLPSPVDGQDHFVALHEVPGYPLAVAVSREPAAALAAWRQSAVETGLRMLFLGAFAVCLLWIALRQLSKAQLASRALEISEGRYSLAMTGSDEGHWTWDIPERQIYISHRMAELFAIPGGAQTMADEDYFSAIPLHADDRERVHQARQDHFLGHTSRLDHEFRVVRAGTGEIRWMHTRAQCFRDAEGTPLRMAGATVDVTARKRAELALRESEERYALAMTGSSGGHWVWDVGRDELFVSPSVRQLLGMPGKEAVLSRADFIERVPFHPEDRDRVLQSIEDQLRAGASRIEYEARIALVDGTVRWVLSRARRFVTGPDEIRIAGISVDITERKRAESEREDLERRLLHAQKLEAIGTLAGGIAHDFNNILAAILGYGELAQRHAPKGSPLLRYIDASMAAGAKAKSLVERILAFSRSGLSDHVLVHAGAAVREALESLAGSIPASVQLRSCIEAGNAAVRCDKVQLHQIVINLCMNSVQALPASVGVVTVTVKRRVLEQSLIVTTSTLDPGDYLVLEVRDSGEGISAEIAGRIFDPFFTTREVGVGTGLGLSLVHGIATELAGGIHVESGLASGACMQVFLPIACEVAEASLPSLTHIERGEGQAVLVVDDEQVLVSLAEEALAELGYEPVGFTSPRAALEAFKADPMRFDVVLSDEAMPGMTGLELAGAISELRQDIPFLLMSGFVTPSILQHAEQGRVAAVLTKPLTGPEIARALAKALRHPLAKLVPSSTATT